MKIYLSLLAILIINSLYAQNGESWSSSKVVHDDYLNNGEFNVDKHAKLTFTTSKVSTTFSSRSTTDTIRSDSSEIEVIENCNISDSANIHYPFDHCTSYFSKDTLVIQFTNNRSLLSTLGYHNKLILYVIKGFVYARYLPNKSRIWQNPFASMLVVSEKLVLKKLNPEKGERVEGQLKIQLSDGNPAYNNTTITLSGPFSCMVN